MSEVKLTKAEERFAAKCGQLINQTEFEMRDRIKKAICSGELDIEDSDDDYRLPKVFMQAVCLEMADQWRPHTSDGRQNVINLRCFL